VLPGCATVVRLPKHAMRPVSELWRDIRCTEGGDGGRCERSEIGDLLPAGDTPITHPG
jgi:hypothetical protein